MDGISSRAKRRFLVRWWWGQWAALHLGFPVVVGLCVDEDVKIAEIVFDPAYAAWMAGIAAFLALLHWLYLRPVRPPKASDRPVGLAWSMTVAGLVVGVLLTAVFLAFVGFAQDVLGAGGIGEWALWSALVFLCFNWLMATLLLHSFGSRSASAKDYLARVAAVLFAGTIVEVLAILPLDVIARRHNDCWCWRGTLWGVTLGIAAGLILLGPATLLLLLARRRRRWPGGRCQACGADVGDDLRVPRCPACGVGWAAA